MKRLWNLLRGFVRGSVLTQLYISYQYLQADGNLKAEMVSQAIRLNMWHNFNAFVIESMQKAVLQGLLRSYRWGIYFTITMGIISFICGFLFWTPIQAIIILLFFWSISGIFALYYSVAKECGDNWYTLMLRSE